MRRRLAPLLLALLLAPLPCTAATTPVDAPLPEDQITTIEVDYAGGNVRAGAAAVPTKPGTYHYKVYVPTGYAADAGRTYPTLFVFSPGGDAGMTDLEARLRRDRWIVVMLVESRNGEWDPIAANFVAAHDDVTKRLRVAEGFKVATGLSGGARAASLAAAARPGFAAVLCQGAGFWTSNPAVQYDVSATRVNPRLCVALTVGDGDPNHVESALLAKALPAGTPFRPLFFKGRHEWAPEAVANNALDWIEEIVYVQAPQTAAMKPLYVARAEALFAAADGATGLEKYDLLDRATDLVAKRRLLNEPSLKAKLPDARRQMTAMKADRDLKPQLNGREAYWRASGAEDLARARLGRNAPQLRTALLDVGRSYAAVAEKFGDTPFGKAAQERVDSLELELK